MGQQSDPIGTLSNLMSLKQQRQQLQVGAQQVQQGQLETQRQQAIQDFYKDFDPTEITAPDGSLDLHKAFSMPKYKAAGNAKPFIAENLITLRQKGLEATNALANLDHNVVSQFGTGLGAYINDQDVKDDTPIGRAKTAEFIKSFGALDAEHAKIMNMYSLVVDHAPPGKLASSLRVIQQQAQSASEQQAQQNPRTGAIDNGPNVILTNTDVPTGAVSQTGTISKGPSPAVVTLPNSQIGTFNGGKITTVPTTPEAPSTAPAGKLGALQRPSPNAPKIDQDNYNAQIQKATADVEASRTVANDPMNGVQATRFRNQSIMDLIPHAATGPGLQMLNSIASRLPGASGDAYQDIEHYTAQNSAALAKTMGVPGTNLGAETAAAAAGSVHKNPGALMEITRTNDALNTAFDMYNRGLQKVTRDGNDMSRVNSYKQAFGSALDINAIRWLDAHRRGDTQEIADLTKKLGPGGIEAAQNKLKTLKTLADKGDLP